MAKSILKFLISSMEIFTEERRRHFSKELLEKDQEVKDQENARFPDYNDDKLALAREALESFLTAYQAEFDMELKKLKAGVVPSE